MATRRCEQCENCFKHVESIYCAKSTKNCNGRHSPRLLTCARCKEVRYCSRECQRLQWAEHKSACDTQVTIMKSLDFLGDKIARTFKAFARFSKNIAGYLETPAMSALKLHRGMNRVETHCFLITVKAKETIFRETSRGIRGCITFKVENAEGVTMDYMHELLDYRSGPFYTPADTERTLSHRRGLMRIFVRDISGFLPAPLDGYTLPTDISNWPPGYHRQYDPQWQTKFYESIGQRIEVQRPTQYGLDGFEFDTGDDEEIKASLKVPPARPSSPIAEEEKETKEEEEREIDRSTTPASDESADSATGFNKLHQESVTSANSTPNTSRFSSPCQGAYIEEIDFRPPSPTPLVSLVN